MQWATSGEICEQQLTPGYPGSNERRWGVARVAGVTDFLWRKPQVAIDEKLFLPLALLTDRLAESARRYLASDGGVVATEDWDPIIQQAIDRFSYEPQKNTSNPRTAGEHFFRLLDAAYVNWILDQGVEILEQRARQMLHGRMQAHAIDDVIQTSLCRLVQYRQDLRAPTLLGYWLRVILSQRAEWFRESRKRVAEVSLPEEDLPSGVGEDVSTRKEETIRQAREQALQEMTPAQRPFIAFWIRQLEDLTQEEALMTARRRNRRSCWFQGALETARQRFIETTGNDVTYSKVYRWARSYRQKLERVLKEIEL